ncbi:MAG: DUF2018 family protein [Campylobacterales bacterium]
MLDKVFGEIFEGSPKDRFFEILYQANRNLVKQEIDNYMRRVAAMEMMLERLHPEWERDIPSMLVTEEKEIVALADNNYIDLMATIVSQNE